MKTTFLCIIFALCSYGLFTTGCAKNNPASTRVDSTMPAAVFTPKTINLAYYYYDTLLERRIYSNISFGFDGEGYSASILDTIIRTILNPFSDIHQFSFKASYEP